MPIITEELKSQTKRNILVVISGPTCSGKDSVMKQLLVRNKNMRRLITTNSRAKRKDETNGVDYYFVSKKDFEELIAQDAFFEWVEYRGDYRGGQKKHVQDALKSGKDVVWRIDVRGVKNIYKKVKRDIPHSVFIFLTEDLLILKKRMTNRATEDKKWQNWSLNRATWELKQYQGFDYLVKNKQGQLDKAVAIIEMIIETEKRKIFK
ncbi:guanylate kinase [Patescibacteria group bacterium]|nr:guanylate kinase [Patescibacteria group bacterium]MBU1931539.1 guanylate kinase [Patescibacteria group bacterium]